PPAQPPHRDAALPPAPRKAAHPHALPRPPRRDPHPLDDGMGRLQRRQDALLAGAQLEPLQRLAVADADVLHPSAVLPVTVLRPDAGVIEPRRNRMDRRRLAVLVL